jgi:YVTN family beta-propeller protein
MISGFSRVISVLQLFAGQLGTTAKFLLLRDHCEVFTVEDTLRVGEIDVDFATQTVYATLPERSSSDDSTTLYKSTDEGITWVPVRPKEGEIYVATTVSCHAKSSSQGVVLVGYEDKGAFWTENEGASWKQKNNSLLALEVSAVAISPVSQSSQYTMYAVTSKGICSRQHGISAKWQALRSQGLADTVVAEISVGSNPWDVTVNEDASVNKIYVTNNADDNVNVVDGATNTVMATVDVGDSPQGICVNSGTKKIYVANQGDSSISVIDGITNAVTGTIGVRSLPAGICVNRATNRIYVANKGDNSVSVIGGTAVDTIPDTLITDIGVGNSPQGICVNRKTNKIYVANYADSNISVIDGDSSVVDTVIGVGNAPSGICVNIEKNRIYVVNEGDNNIMVIDGTDNAVIATIGVGDTPKRVCVNPKTNKIYVTNEGDNSVTVINGASNEVMATVGVGSVPGGICVNTEVNAIYIANYDDDNISVLDGAGPAVTLLAAHATDKQVVFAGTGSGVFRWDTGESGWHSVNAGLTDLDIKAIACDPQDSSIIYCATGSGAFRSTDGGSSWELKNSGLTNTDVYAINVDPTNSSLVYAGTNGGGVFKSEDGADSWTAINEGFSDWGVPPYIYQVPAITAAGNDILYAGTLHGIFTSVSTPEVWAENNKGILTSFIKHEVLDSMVLSFEHQTPGYPTQGVYQIVRDSLGEEPDVDGNSKVTILVLDIDEHDSYFDQVNQYPQSVVDTLFGENYGSNEQEVLYIDVELNLQDNAIASGELAYCFQKPIHWKYDNNEAKWMTEGCSGYAKFLVGCATTATALPVSNDITFWGDSPDASERNLSYLFMLYLYEKYGGNELIRAIVHDTLNGMEGIDTVLADNGSAKVCAEIYLDFGLAAYLDITDSTFHDGKYGFKNVALSFGVTHHYFSAPLVARSKFWSIAGYGTQAVLSGFDSVFVFNGDSCADLHLWQIRMNKKWTDLPTVSNVIDALPLSLDERNVVQCPLRPDFNTTGPVTCVAWVITNLGEGVSPSPYVLDHDIAKPFYLKLGVLQNPLADEYAHVYVFSNENLYQNVEFETPAIAVIQGTDTVNLEMEVFSRPAGDTLATIYRGTHKLSVGEAEIVVTGEDIAGNQLDTVRQALSVAIIGPDGGTLNYQHVSLDFPGQALAKETHVTVFPLDGLEGIPGTDVPPCPDIREPIGSPYRIGPSTLKLSKPGILTFSYDDDVDPKELGLYRVEDNNWIYVGGIVNPERKSISCDIEVLGTYQVQLGPHPSSSLPRVFKLCPVAPNPFGVSAMIHYELPKQTHVSIRVYDVTGRVVKTLVNGQQKPGYRCVQWAGNDDSGNNVSCGVYFVKMNASNFNSVRKSIYLTKEIR